MSNDLISRQTLRIDMYNEVFEKGSDEQRWDSGCWIRYKMFERVVDRQPSAQPKQRWIPCSERLPEEHESVWAKAKGTDRWSEAMWEKQSDEVIVTELFEDGTTRTDTACTHDGEWYVRVKIIKRKIIAWMPLPEPYKGET